MSSHRRGPRYRLSAPWSSSPLRAPETASCHHAENCSRHEYHADVGLTGKEIEAAAERLIIEAGHRFTRNRKALFDVMLRAGRPLTADEAARLSGQPVSTVYRNLTVLAEAEVMRAMPGFHRFERFEITESLRGEHFHHLVCVQCEAVVAYTAPEELEDVVERLAPPIAKAKGFCLLGHTLDLVGLCASCAKAIDAAAKRTSVRKPTMVHQ